MRARRLAAVWLQSFREWVVPGGLAACAYDLYYVTGWPLILTPREMVNEAAAIFLLGCAPAIAIAVVVAMAWVIADLFGAAGRRLQAALEPVGTAFSLLCTAMVVVIVAEVWIKSVKLASLGLPVRMAIIPLCLVVIAIPMAMPSRRQAYLRKAAKNLRLLSMPILALLPVGIVAASLGIHWRNYDETPRSQSPISATESRPNIILISFDALSANDMSLYGYGLPTTPNFDEFAKKCIVFDRFYSASNFTTSSIASILTGMSVPAHRVLDIGGRIPPSLRSKTLPFVLHQHGYVTGVVATNPVAHPIHLGIEDGVDYLPPPPRLPNGPINWTTHFGQTDLYREAERAWGKTLRSVNLVFHTEFGVDVAPPALAFDDARIFVEKQLHPYFLWVHLKAPHFYYGSSGEHAGAFLKGKDFLTYDDYVKSGLSDEIGPYAPDRQPEFDRIHMRYDEYVAHADDALGSFLRWLNQSGNLTNTAVLVTADHGESFDHGYWGHANYEMWDDVVHIPFIVHLPDGSHAGQRVSGVAGGIDIFPTIADLAGVSVPATVQGSSLRAMWDGSAEPPRRSISFLGAGQWDRPITDGMAAVIEDKWKFIYRLGAPTGQLYDLPADRRERTDLSSREVQEEQRLRADLLRWLADQPVPPN